MNNFDNAFWWAVLSLPALVLVANYVLRQCYNELVAIHVVVFWAQFFAYGVTWLYSQTSFFFFPGWSMALLAIELTIYCGVFLIFSPFLNKYARDVSNAALEVGYWTLFCWIAPSVTLSIYIVASYGVVALIPYANMAESAGLPSWLIYLNITLLAPAWGAVYCCAVRLAYRKYHPVQILALGFVVGRMFFETGQGKRYFLIVCMVAVLFGRDRPYRVTGRVVLNVVLAAVLVLTAWTWYEGIRRNMGGILMTGKTYDSSFDAVGDIFAPSAESSETDLLAQDFRNRTPPFWLLLEIIELPNLGYGVYVSHAIQNTVPSITTDKQWQNENDVLASTTDLPYDDYPWTLMTELHAEMSAWAVLLTPAIYIFMFWLCWALIASWRRRSDMILLVAIGVAVFLAGEVQNHLTIIFREFRTLAIYVAVGFVAFHVRSVLRVVLVRWDHHLRNAMRLDAPASSSTVDTTFLKRT